MPRPLYYAQLDNEFFGPFSLETIVDMHLTPDVSVLSTETNTWKQACEYPELIDSLDVSLYELNDEVAEEEIDEEDDEENSIDPPPSFNERSVFYIRRGGNPYGPYTLEALASVPLSENTSISVDGMIKWYKPHEISGLMNTLASIASWESRTESKANNVEQEQTNNGEEISKMLNRLQSLVPSKKQLFKRVFSSKEDEQDFIIGEYNRVFNTVLNLVRRLGETCNNSTISKRAIIVITNSINETVNQINKYYLEKLDQLQEAKPEFATTSISIGSTTFSLPSPLDEVKISRIDFLKVLGDKNLYVTYDAVSKNKAFGFLNSVVGKLYKKNPARLVVTNVIDTDFMTGLDDAFKLLNRDLYKIISRTDDVRNNLTLLQNRASSILQNLLVEKDATLQDYNDTHENKEASIILVLKDFPHGLQVDNLEVLKRLANVGPKVGIYVIILTSNEHLENMSERDADIFNLTEFANNANTFNFRNDDKELLRVLDIDDTSEENTEYELLSDVDLKHIVQNLNAKCELREDVIVSFSDYIPNPKDWWSGDSAKQIEVPFGISDDMQIKSLKITQESGQNTAVVIGIPGSGKSVFLHTLICSAAIKYSPDELRMYLIDFSGVEFNSYALGKLPHARVIAPEAEREFGLSILNELVEEGSRRMALCRDHNVSNIVDLKRVAPGIKIPRLLVIIDEFQKLFEVDNDPISKEANSKIHIIIQEFRKFGINLVLATQKLPSSSFLPRDLIANRVVFKSAPNDFDSLITSETHRSIPKLRTGQCVYNSESGASYANETVQGFFTSKTDLDSLMVQIRDFEKGFSYEREPLKVFRSAELPVFEECRRADSHISKSIIPYIVPIYFGESIAVSDVDVNVELVKENANNILIIGGEVEIARRITFNAMRSAISAHEENTGKVVVLSGMRNDNPINEMLDSFASETLCEFEMATSISEVETILKSLKDEIEQRRVDEQIPQQHIYVTCFDFQSIRALDKDMSGTMPKLSAAAKDMEQIIRNGSSVGVFVIAQTDTLEGLNRIGNSSPLSQFNFRVALQMSEDLSYKVVGTPMANKLFVFNRPSSRFRGYIRDNARNQTIKFKPYK